MALQLVEPVPAFGTRVDGAGQGELDAFHAAIQHARKASITTSWRLLCPPVKNRPTVRMVRRSGHGTLLAPGQMAWGGSGGSVGPPVRSGGSGR